jgi:hypothetical protein
MLLPLKQRARAESIRYYFATVGSVSPCQTQTFWTSIISVAASQGERFAKNRSTRI